MAQKEHWTDTLRRKEKTDENRYFAEQERKQIEKLHRQHQPSQETELPEPDGQVATVQSPPE